MRRRLPEGVLVCNFPRPAQPALMEHEDVVTLFHEFGHLMHHVLGGQQALARLLRRRDRVGLRGGAVADARGVGLDPDVLRRFARHVETGEPIPAELVERMNAADEFGKGLLVRQQMFYAACLGLHRRTRRSTRGRGRRELQKPLHAVSRTWRGRTSTSRSATSTATRLYYTYMWSLVIAKDLFGPFREAGLMDAGPARRYRRTGPGPGGSKPAAADLVEDFLGAVPRFEAFRRGWSGPEL